MFITPIEKIESLSAVKGIGSTKPVSSEKGQGFQDILANLIQTTKDTDASLSKNEYLLSTGQIDDVHTIPIEAQKAQLSLDLLIQIRNKTLDSYNELMRMSL